VPEYAELHCHSNFSFLDGASHPIELVLRAKELGLSALAITDRGGVYGAVRFLKACEEAELHGVVGACLEVDGRELVLLARSRAGYSKLCRLLSQAHLGQPKGEARTTLGTVKEHWDDLYCLAASDDRGWLEGLGAALGDDSVFVELHDHLRRGDRWVLERRVELAERVGLRTVATNHVRYHDRSRRPLHDVLTAIRHRATLEEVRDRLPSNSEQVLKGPAEMAELFRRHPEAVATAAELAAGCQVKLEFGDVRLPGFEVPDGKRAFDFLWGLADEGVQARYGGRTPDAMNRLNREMQVIEKTNLAEFFLINWDLVEFARRNHVP
jgi:error-prone DNA polymerase